MIWNALAKPNSLHRWQYYLSRQPILTVLVDFEDSDYELLNLKKKCGRFAGGMALHAGHTTEGRAAIRPRAAPFQARETLSRSGLKVTEVFEGSLGGFVARCSTCSQKDSNIWTSNVNVRGPSHLKVNLKGHKMASVKISYPKGIDLVSHFARWRRSILLRTSTGSWSRVRKVA